jgi:hypothetical protein
MAKTVSEQLVCDVCGTTTNVAAYTIVTPEGAAVVDLCAGDAKPLLKLWHVGSTEPRKRVTGKTRPPGHAVIPVD